MRRGVLLRYGRSPGEEHFHDTTGNHVSVCIMYVREVYVLRTLPRDVNSECEVREVKRWHHRDLDHSRAIEVMTW